MGIYLGQLPPAEVARLKAELAETIIANFCYPRFFDYRTESLRMRPVDRAKRQEVWLYLSSVDFTTWSRLDLMSQDFQRQIERLFIQFVQRNRSFFGDQGRKRMSDVRMLIGTSSASVVQGLRNHLTGQRTSNPTFGSPRPVVSWSTSKKTEIGWEHIAAATMLLQQQLQEIRGEVKPSVQAESRPTNGVTRRPTSPHMPATASQPVPPTANVRPMKTTSPLPEHKTTAPLNPPTSRPVAPAASTAPGLSTRGIDPPSIAKETPTSVPKAIAINQAGSASPTSPELVKFSPSAVAPSQVQSRNLPQAATTTGVLAGQRENQMMRVGEDDIAIFEQMRHQLMLWLRVEAVHSGVELSGQSPSQLLELLRQQDKFDETRLQVVSTLLNLSNQVIKNGQVSVLDYKQALMFHLMHTRR